MKNKAKTGLSTVWIEAEVARRIRQHGRSSMKTEVCGVLIGREENGSTFIDACIAGVNAAQAGTHVTFTQETWEHIYKIKDKEYPDERIVGWYHSHPGFGVFLSDHDLFIQENFFSSPNQVAWVYDPHTDEEGCFGWRGDKVEKINDVRLRYEVPLGDTAKVADEEDDEVVVIKKEAKRDPDELSWTQIISNTLLYLTVFALGALGMFYYLGTVAVVVPKDKFVDIMSENEALKDFYKRIHAMAEQQMTEERLRQQQSNRQPTAPKGNPPQQQQGAKSGSK